MLLIGITGGVGAGKSTVLDYLQIYYNTRTINTDIVAHNIINKEENVIKMNEIFKGDDIYNVDGSISTYKLSFIIFKNHLKRELYNQIIAPALKEYIINERKRAEEDIDMLIVESALLIENEYYTLCDKIWYIYTNRPNRTQRLKLSRHYTKSKTESIMNTQLTEDNFRKYCDEEIENNKGYTNLYKQVDSILKKYNIQVEVKKSYQTDVFNGIMDLFD